MPKSIIEQKLQKIVSEICSFKEAKTWKIHRMEHITANQFSNRDLGDTCVNYLIQKQKWRDTQAIQKALDELKKKKLNVLLHETDNFLVEVIRLSDVVKSFGEVKDAKNK